MASETIALIQQMARENHTWGAERIRGELLKLGIRVATRTVQKYMRSVRPPQSPDQTWRTFMKNHAHISWACDFLPVVDLFFSPSVSVFHYRTWIAAGDPFWGHAYTNFGLGGAAIARCHTIDDSTEVFDSRQRL